MQASMVLVPGYRRQQLLQPAMRSSERCAWHWLPLHSCRLQGPGSLVR